MNVGTGCEGLFVPGGSIATMYALHVSRMMMVDPQIRNKGRHSVWL